MEEVVMGVLGLAIAYLSGAYQTLNTEIGGILQTKLVPLARELTKRINSKNIELSDLMQAYNDRSGRLATTLLHSAGLGARASALAKEIDSNESRYRAQLHKLNQEIANLNTELRAVDEAQSVAGTSFHGNVTAGKVALKEGIREQIRKTEDQNPQQETDVNQNIQGGLTNV